MSGMIENEPDLDGFPTREVRQVHCLHGMPSSRTQLHAGEDRVS